MKLQRRSIEKDGSGSVVVYPREAEDLWHCYNLISVGDQVTATTIRRIQKESTTGSVESERKRVTLTIQVGGIDFDVVEGGHLRLSGRVSQENRFVKLGSFHTLDIQLNHPMTLWKSEWDAVALQRLDDSCSDRTRSSAAALVLAEGVANLCLLTDSMTLTKAHITQNIPRKRKASAAHHDKSLERFFQSCYEAMKRYVAWESVKVVVIASPGFVKEQFHQFMLDTAVRNDDRDISQNKSKIMLVHSSSGHKHSLTEVLRDKTVQAQMQDTKAAKEVLSLSKFYEMLKKEPDRAVYGYNHVKMASDNFAVETLLLSDNLFRAKSVATRKMYVELVDLVKQQGGEALIFSSLHVSGEQLAQLSGVAAILRFPIPGLDDELMEEEPEAYTEVGATNDEMADQLQARFHSDDRGEQRLDDTVGIHAITVNAMDDSESDTTEDFGASIDRVDEDVSLMMGSLHVDHTPKPQPLPAKKATSNKPQAAPKSRPKAKTASEYLEEEGDDDWYGDDDDY